MVFPPGKRILGTRYVLGMCSRHGKEGLLLYYSISRSHFLGAQPWPRVGRELDESLVYGISGEASIATGLAKE